MFFSWESSVASCKNSFSINCVPKWVPQPVTTPLISKGIQNIQKFSPNHNAIIYTWWDYGYWINLITNLTTVIDASGNHRLPKGYLVAKSVMSKSQKTSYNIINYVLSKKNDAIYADSKNFETLRKNIIKGFISSKGIFIIRNRYVKCYPSKRC